MVVPLNQTDGELDRVEEWRIGQGHTTLAKIGGNIKRKNILAGREAGALQQGAVAAAISVGDGFAQDLS